MVSCLPIMVTSPLLIESHDSITRLTLNRPESRNALNTDLLEALETAFAALSPDTRVIILQGAGDAFMAGGDIRQFKEAIATNKVADLFGPMMARVNRLAQLITRLPQPVIASVHGSCAGFGISLMLACDLVVAAGGCKFTLAYNRLGLSPDGGASWQLVQNVGLKRASQIALLGELFSTEQAERWGLVNYAVPAEQLAATTDKLAQQLAGGASDALSATKKLLQQATRNSLDEHLSAEATSFLKLTETQDFAEGVDAFLNKRPPVFKGTS